MSENRRGVRGNNRKRGLPPWGLAIILLVCVGLVASLSFFISSNETFFAGKSEDDAFPVSKVDGDMERLLNSNVIYDNIYINDIKVSGLTKAEAKNKVENSIKKNNNFSIILTDGENSHKIEADANNDYEIEKAVNDAFNYARTGSDSSRYEKILKLEAEKVVFEANLFEYSESFFESQLIKIKPTVDVPPIDAVMTRVDGEFRSVPEIPGREFSIEDTVLKIMEAINSNKGETEIRVPMVFHETIPKITAADVSKATSLLGTFTTYFVPSSGDRNVNIKVAAEKINDYVVAPGEVFSTNKAFGPSTYENGYRNAPVIVGGQLVDGIGGGMCQVSSTLYMALLNAELEIVERQNHSLRVGYMEGGCDATLAGDVIDLKFRNSSDYPVTIETLFNNSKGVLTVNVYGYENRPSNRKLKFESALVSSTPPEVEVVQEDPTLPLGQRVVKTAAKTGYTYYLYKLVYVDDVLTDKIKINTSVYRPVRGVVSVGTGPAVEEPQTPVDPSEPPVNPVDGEVPQIESPVASADPSETASAVPPETPAPTETSDPPETQTPTPSETPATPVEDYPVIEDNIPTIQE